jgi:DNA polymerase III subunit beta
LPARPVIPVLSGLLVQAAGAGLTLSCFDYEVSARVAIPAEIDEPGTVLVPGRLLAEITRSLPPRPVEFSSDADMVRLSCGSAEFELVSLPVQEYPGLPEPPDPSGTVDGGVLAAAAAQVGPSASRDDTLPMLTGVCLDIDGTELTLAATDRYRLAVRTVQWRPADPGLRVAALVPARTLADVARTMGPGIPVTIAFSHPENEGSGRTGGAEPRPAEGMISFEGGGRRLTARLIAGDFIRYRSRFPAEFGCRAELPADLFTTAVRRVSLVAERASPVRLTFGHGEVVIEAHTDGRARAAESVRAAFTGAEPVISFNPAYLLDGLAAASICGAGTRPPGATDPDGPGAEPGRVRLEFTSPAKPALITWVGYEADLEAGVAAAESRAAREPAPGESPIAEADAGATDTGEASASATSADAGDTSATSADAGDSGAGDADGDEDGTAGTTTAAEGTAGSERTGREATFRYLVVPLRSPVAAGGGR